MGFYLIGPLITLISLGSISSWAFKPYCDDGLLGISPTATMAMGMEGMESQDLPSLFITLVFWRLSIFNRVGKTPNLDRRIAIFLEMLLQCVILPKIIIRGS
jgi:hypothetical protein